MVVDIKVKGAIELRAKMMRFQKQVQRPDHSYSIRQMARIWNTSYRAEGSSVGGWPELSPYTQRKRKERGFKAKHPILVQTGRMRELTITTLMKSNRPFRANRKGISVSSVYTGLVAVLNASGEKASNQTGGKNTFGTTPARPFWFVDSSVSGAAAKGLEQWVTKMLRVYK